MKVITIRQPWAFAIIRLGKDVENRSWATSYVGPILIHAAKGLTRTELLSSLDDIRACLDVDGISSLIRKRMVSMSRDPNDYVRGAVVGVAELAACPLRPLRRGGPGFSKWHTPGAWGHRINKFRALEDPLPWKGMLGYVDAPPTLVEAVRRSLKK